MGGVKIYKIEELPKLVEALNEGLVMEQGYLLALDAPLDQKRLQVIENLPSVVCFALASEYWTEESWPPYIQGYIRDFNDPIEIKWALEAAQRAIEKKHEIEHLRFSLLLEKERREDIMGSALELAEERDLPKLCDKILSKIRRMLHAEAASLFLFDEKKNELRFSHVQNEKLQMPWKEFSLPLDENSIVGATAVRKSIIHLSDVYQIPEHETFKFNSSFDEKTGYRTKSLLSLPLMKTNGELVGVVQIINAKNSDDFSAEEIQIGKVLSTHIAVAIETALLYQNIETLFEGFIHASITAIESRDPTTSGHSERVAELTVRLAEVVHDSDHKEFRKVRFNDQQLKEIRYASLLHDFGKIGVPEKVLVKEKKLFPEDLRELEQRFQIFGLAFPNRQDEFNELWSKILEANEPTILIEELKSNLADLVGQELEINGDLVPILTPDEWDKLSVRKGSLSPVERDQIQSHVVHSQKFLETIPWTRELSRVPEIAASHHERLDGRGYPRGLKKEEIPFESQIMAVTDVFDALTAMDRPYKKAVPLKKALQILGFEANDFKLNPELVELFEQQKVYEVISKIDKA